MQDTTRSNMLIYLISSIVYIYGYGATSTGRQYTKSSLLEIKDYAIVTLEV